MLQLLLARHADLATTEGRRCCSTLGWSTRTMKHGGRGRKRVYKPIGATGDEQSDSASGEDLEITMVTTTDGHSRASGGEISDGGRV